MPAILLPQGKQQYFTSAGVPLVGGKVYTYDAGTLNARVTYSDAAAAVPNANPVVLDARGEATIFWAGAYKVILKDSLDVTVWTVDNVGALSGAYSVIDNYSIDSGVANAYVVAAATALTAYVAGLRVAVKVINTNTGTSTLNYMGLGVKNITTDNHALGGGEMQSGGIYVLMYDGVNFQLINPTDVPKLRLAAEIAASVTPANYSYVTRDVRRFGLIPNSSGAASANTAALTALLNPSVTGPQGTLEFVNTTGADTYYFNGMIPVRDGTRMDLNGCTLNFTKSYNAPTDDYMGFFTFIRDVTIENGNIDVIYAGGGALNAGPVMRIGSRLGYPFAAFTGGITEENLTVPMGHIMLRNLRLTTTNNVVGGMILMLGGLRDCIFENLAFNGGAKATDGFAYEFGDYHYEATVANRTTTHASGLHFRNIFVTNMKTSSGGGSGISLTGAASALIENLRVDGAYHIVEFRPGEALFYNPGTPDLALVKRCITLRNIQGKNIVNTGLSLVGAESKAGGYLAGEPLTESQQTDLMRFSVDGGIISAAGAGMLVSGPIDIRNVTFNGSASSGQVVISDECIRAVFTNCEIRNSGGIGVRANFGDKLWAVARLKTLVFVNCQVTGNTGAGYSIGHTKSVEIIGGRIGNQAVIDGVAETTQTPGVSVDQTSLGGGVHCMGVDVAVSAGSAYSITGTITNPCGFSHPKGTYSFTGNWDRDGVAYANSTDIAAKANFPNAPSGTCGKYAGRLCFDTSNNRLMIATGPADVDTWRVADNSVTVTPT